MSVNRQNIQWKLTLRLDSNFYEGLSPSTWVVGMKGGVQMITGCMICSLKHLLWEFNSAGIKCLNIFREMSDVLSAHTYSLRRPLFHWRAATLAQLMCCSPRWVNWRTSWRTWSGRWLTSSWLRTFIVCVSFKHIFLSTTGHDYSRAVTVKDQGVTAGED